MRKVAMWGFVVIAVAVLFTGAQAQRITLAPTVAPTKSPQQVEVTNFPAVQTVDGTVNVGNLPIDGDGNVRVADAPSYRWTQVVDQSLPPGIGGIGYTFGPFDVAGWRRASFLIVSNGASMQGTVQWGGNGFFVDAGVTPNAYNVVFTTDVAGPQAQLRIYPTGNTNITVWLYLSN